MTDTTFIRLLDGEDRPARLREAVRNLQGGHDSPDVHRASPESFRQVPGSPFAYWVSEEVRRKFVDYEPVENGQRVAQHGVSTKDDFRFIRLHWEVPPVNLLDGANGSRTEVGNFEEWCHQRMFEGKRWVTFAKGGEYSTYYADVHLLVDWEKDAQRIEASVLKKYPYLGDNANWVIHRECHYFRPGLTWSARTQGGLSFRTLPSSCIFASKGPVIFAPSGSLAALLAIVNSAPFHRLVALQMAFGSYEVGVIQRTPVPEIPAAASERLSRLALRCVEIKRTLDSANETSHAFHLPALLQVPGETLAERVGAWERRVTGAERELSDNQREIDDLTFDLYGISGEDRAAMESGGNVSVSDPGDGEGEEPAGQEVGASVAASSLVIDLVTDLVSYAVGCAFGRWDIRIALDPSLAPELADPFDPLPVCSPGTLVGPDAMPVKLGYSGGEVASEEWLRARPDAITPPEDSAVVSPSISQDEYPVEIDRDGILASDPGRLDDIVLRVRGVFETLFGENAEGIEDEACTMLGVKDLRAYFDNPRKFFDHHTKRYSRSRRKAPVYWLLQSPKKKYGLWVYYHRLDGDIIYKCLTRYLDQKLNYEEDRLAEDEAALREASEAGGSASRQAERAVATRQDLISDLKEFRVRLAGAADLELVPDLDDGVVLNIAPLHEVVPWKEAKTRWDELLSGKHEWSHISGHLRRKGLV